MFIMFGYIYLCQKREVRGIEEQGDVGGRVDVGRGRKIDGFMVGFNLGRY